MRDLKVRVKVRVRVRVKVRVSETEERGQQAGVGAGGRSYGVRARVHELVHRSPLDEKRWHARGCSRQPPDAAEVSVRRRAREGVGRPLPGSPVGGAGLVHPIDNVEHRKRRGVITAAARLRPTGLG